MSFVKINFSTENGDALPTPSTTVVNWESFTFTDTYLHASSSFIMKIGDNKVTDALRSLFNTGCTRVQIQIDIGNGNPRTILTGRIDEAIMGGDADNGQVVWHLTGRSLLGTMIDYEVDPWSSKYQITDGTTVEQLVAAVVSHWGWNSIVGGSIADRSVKTGNSQFFTQLQSRTITTTQETEVDQNGQPVLTSGGNASGTFALLPVESTVTSYYDPTNNFGLETLTLKQSHPEDNEKAYSFIERVVKRFGFHCTSSADGTMFIVDKPDYTQAPIYAFTYSMSDPSKTNILHHTKKIECKEQPAMIIGRGQTEAGDLNSTTIRGAKISEFYGYNSNGNPTASVIDDLKPYTNLTPIPINSNLSSYNQYFNQPVSSACLYVYDKHATSVQEIENTITRKMAEYMRKALVLTYVVEDFYQTYNNQTSVYAVNTMASVNDELFGISGNFWVESIKMSLDEHGGTYTEITLIPPFCLIISPK